MLPYFMDHVMYSFFLRNSKITPKYIFSLLFSCDWDAHIYSTACIKVQENSAFSCFISQKKIYKKSLYKPLHLYFCIISVIVFNHQWA